MAHFAKLDEYNTVTEVVVVNNNVITVNSSESEQAGIDFLTNLFGYGKWKQTSYNNNMRKRFAGIGYQYREDLDAFIPPKIFSSWTFNESTCDWDPPIARPTDGKDYTWDEVNQSWIEYHFQG
jgi:hypothetical protein